MKCNVHVFISIYNMFITAIFFSIYIYDQICAWWYKMQCELLCKCLSTKFVLVWHIKVTDRKKVVDTQIGLLQKLCTA